MKGSVRDRNNQTPINRKRRVSTSRMRALTEIFSGGIFQKKLWLWLFVMALLSPLGIILPEQFDAQDAWGEWGIDTIEKLLGFIPEGMKKTADLWVAPIPDYAFGGEHTVLTTKIFSYIISGFLGIVITSLIMIIIAGLLCKHEK